MAEIAVAIVSWNTRELLDRCLDSMRADAEAGLAEVWVVDNGSSDGSQALVRERHPWATLLETGENLGYGPAVNRVAERTRTPWVAPSNADIVLHEGALAALLAAGRRDRGAAVIAPRLLLPSGETQPSVQPFPGPLTTARALLPALGRRRDGWDPERSATVPWVTGAFFVVRREAWDAIGGFDDAQWMYAEDIDVCWRATRAGWTVRYEPAAVADHMLSAAASSAFGGEMNARWQRATYAWMARRRGVATVWATAALGLLGTLPRYAALRLLDRARPGRWTARVERARGDLAAARLGLRSRSALLAAR